MNRRIIIAALAPLPLLMGAQTAYDAYQISRYDLRGTARFMSMGGAFGALGGDLSVLGQNPGGIGVYRKSDIGITLDIDSRNISSPNDSRNRTNISVSNLGYVGSVYTGSEIMPIFNWGFSYGRTNSFKRKYNGSATMQGSLSNHIAAFTNGCSSDLLGGSTSDDVINNYMQGGGAPWLSILAFNSYVINPTDGGPETPSTMYSGLWREGTSRGISTYNVDESGYVDEYNINFGGNFSDVVYWGIGFGITDMEYRQNVYYTEDMTGGYITTSEGSGVTETPGNLGFGLNSYQRISGSGFNFKAGLIFRPINELRLGFAVHTPTYYNLSQSSIAEIDYGYGYTDGPAAPGYANTPQDDYDWKLRTPWRLMVSAAGVIGSQAIISMDYEYRPYQKMVTKNDNGDNQTGINNDIENYYKAANIIRLGAEYRLPAGFSLRAGYAYESTPTAGPPRANSADSYMPDWTMNPGDTGTTPSYTMDNSAQYITCGLGYRYQGFYADFAYVHKARNSTFSAFTPSGEVGATPYDAKLKQSDNSFVLSLGIKF